IELIESELRTNVCWNICRSIPHLSGRPIFHLAMPNPRHSSKSPVKAQAFALSSVQPPQQQGAWCPPPIYCANGVTLYQDYVRAPPGQVGFALNTSCLENLEGWESLRANDGVDDEANYITPVHSDAVAAPTAHSVAR
ncbi:unnamed protein product, partial [Mycena citricolor]